MYRNFVVMLLEFLMESPTTQTNSPLPLPIDTRHSWPVRLGPPAPRPYPETEPELILIKSPSIHGTGASARRALPKGTPGGEYISGKFSTEKSYGRLKTA